MSYKPKHININNKQVAVANLINTTQTSSERQHQLICFLKEWYADKDFIKVKTSGSTGNPKIIRLKKDFVVASAKRTIKFFGLTKNDRVLHCLPLQYIAGKLMLVRAIIGELNLTLIEPSTDFSLLKKESFKFAAMTPNQVFKLLPLKNWGIQQLLIGGDAISTDLEQKLADRTTSCFSSYGMTETATHIALRKLNGEDSSAYYKCLNGIQVVLSEKGCLEISIPDLGKQFISTNDIAELKSKTMFKVLGRADSIIISGGVKYMPELIEKKINPYLSMPFMISWLPHEKLGKQLVLCVEATESIDLKNELEAICTSKLHKLERPRQILFQKKLPTTKNGKLKRV